MQRSESAHISVIVACRNEIAYIHNFLDSLFWQDLGGTRIEVLIADGMSDDGTRQVLERYRRNFPTLLVIDNPDKITSAGLNAAIHAARGEIIIRMGCPASRKARQAIRDRMGSSPSRTDSSQKSW